MAYCDKCNRMVVIGKMVDGKTVDLDPKAAVYRVVGPALNSDVLMVDRTVSAMPAHSFTCPGVNRFKATEREICP